MPNEVSAKVTKLRTTVDWDEDLSQLVTTLRISAIGITPDQLHQLFLFQSSGALSFVIANAQEILFPQEEMAAAGAETEPR